MPEVFWLHVGRQSGEANTSLPPNIQCVFGGGINRAIAIVTVLELYFSDCSNLSTGDVLWGLLLKTRFVVEI